MVVYIEGISQPNNLLTHKTGYSAETIYFIYARTYIVNTQHFPEMCLYRLRVHPFHFRFVFCFRLLYFEAKLSFNNIYGNIYIYRLEYTK